MKFAFYPGCVSRGGCPELYPSAVAVAQKVGLDLQELTGASCTGAGVLQESNLFLGDCLNARTFAMAERLGLPILTICSTCQGVMAQARYRLQDEGYRQKVNAVLADEGLVYKGTVEVKHLLWVLVEDIGLEKIRSMVVRPLTGLRVAPFYGCYIVRPSKVLGYDEHAERLQALERLIEALGGEPVDFPGKTRCCGFPILTINERNSVAMVAKHTWDAKERGADAMVTPCPLCHLNLDGYQVKAMGYLKDRIDLPILHLPQLVGLALGIDPKTLRLGRHLIAVAPVLDKLGKVAVKA
ncbi:MAG: CoB--CoM heterodisulfide reductase iron-sulfur subunit B family protein [Dehalococcoidia bacterium]|nr:CoB--CoM heterodisulfide reductase iron-sulfur subunit B family protein [Dehalococcoidia bacterium]MDW8119244.1 CoB--CoM heterodisulfide reductase iron-sulfur subunit B family protein [Chloroflexota bacterium]